MLIEKTTLIQFDEVAERQRILSVFKGKRQKDLLTALDLMITGDFVALARAVIAMPESILEYMAMPMQDLVIGVVEQKTREKDYTAGARVRELMSAHGIAFCKESVWYPRFTAIPAAPAVAPAAAETAGAKAA